MRFAAVRMVANGTSRQIPKPRIYCGIDAKQTFVDKRSRPNLQRMTPKRSLAQRRTVERASCSPIPLLTPTLTAVW